MYKIVNKSFGQYPYWPESEEDAILWLKILSKDDPDQWYLRKIEE